VYLPKAWRDFQEEFPILNKRKLIKMTIMVTPTSAKMAKAS